MKRYNITVNGKVYDVQVEEVGASAPAAPAAAAAAPAPVAAPAPQAAAPAEAAPAAPAASAEAPAGAETINAPMPGNILDIKVKAGRSGNQGTGAADPGSDEDGKRNHVSPRRRRGPVYMSTRATAWIPASCWFLFSKLAAAL